MMSKCLLNTIPDILRPVSCKSLANHITEFHNVSSCWSCWSQCISNLTRKRVTRAVQRGGEELPLLHQLVNELTAFAVLSLCLFTADLSLFVVGASKYRDVGSFR